jgi:hypothetical protein
MDAGGFDVSTKTGGQDGIVQLSHAAANTETRSSANQASTNR